MQNDWFTYLAENEFGKVHLFHDAETQLRAIVAIHDTTCGPALGGCRFKTYSNTEEALEDALRLAQGMTYKSVLADLPLGGGKSVIMAPQGDYDRTALFQAFGRMVDSLQGEYITAMDMGTEVTDMDEIRKSTPYVTCTSTVTVGPSDPSVLTARGVFRGIQAACQYQRGNASLEGVRVGVQGIGHVGWHLCELLSEANAKLIVSDMDAERLHEAEKQFGASVVKGDAIYAEPMDVFAPCAVGGILNTHTIAALKATIVAGSANNQLAEAVHGQLLAERGILYAPDFVINAGGIIQVGSAYENASEAQITQRIDGIFDTCLQLFEKSQASTSNAELAETLAREKLQAKQQEVTA